MSHTFRKNFISYFEDFCYYNSHSWHSILSSMADVSPRESIMSLTTTSPEKRKRAKKLELETEALEEESLSCLKLPETVEETEYHWALESADKTEKHEEMEMTTGDLKRHYGDSSNEEKPNLKRRQNSLDESIVEGDASLKKLKISSESKEEDLEV